jgi:hypothetical protein
LLWLQHREIFCLRLEWSDTSVKFRATPELPAAEQAAAIHGDKVKLAFDRVLEIAFPASLIRLKDADRIQVHVELMHGDRLLERWPQSGAWEFPFTPIELEQNSWYI